MLKELLQCNTNKEYPSLSSTQGFAPTFPTWDDCLLHIQSLLRLERGSTVFAHSENRKNIECILVNPITDDTATCISYDEESQKMVVYRVNITCLSAERILPVCYPLKEDIIRIAEELHDRFFRGEGYPMGAMRKLAESVGVVIRYVERYDSIQEEQGKIIISLPENCYTERNLFAAAVYMGHVVLGHDIAKVNSKDETLASRASLFAQNLLMPEKEFRKVCASCGNRVNDVSSHFSVVPSVAEIRMMRLGISARHE